MIFECAYRGEILQCENQKLNYQGTINSIINIANQIDLCLNCLLQDFVKFL